MELVRILVVEDEGVTAMDIQAQLQSLGYDVPALAFSSEEALLQVEKTRPDLILMDIQLKGQLGGIETAKQIREHYTIPIIYLTAYADDETLQQAKVTEPIGYILKPFESTALHSTIEMALYRHKMEQQRAEVLAMLSHDIRNSLGIIGGYADLLARKLDAEHKPDMSEAKEFLRRIQHTGLSARSMVNNYLDVSRLEAGQFVFYPKPLQLDELLERVADQYEAEVLRRHLNLDVCVPNALLRVQADSLALERVFSNLFENALKFAPDASRIVVSAQPQDTQVVVSITNTGPEISSDMLPFLFDKYRQASSAQPRTGVGLGLFIVKTFVEAQGGSVRAENIPSSGVRFSVSLPQAEQVELSSLPIRSA